MAYTFLPRAGMPAGDPRTLEARRQMLAEALSNSAGDTSPIVHPMQGVARMADALVKGLAYRRATNQLQQGRADATNQFNQVFGNLLTGGGARTTEPQGLSATGSSYAGVGAGGAQPESGPVQGADYITYDNTGAIRNQPLSEKLVSSLSFLPELGVTMEVFSGGQPGKGSGGNRVGSTRHDHGNAADVFFYKDGRRLDWSNPDDLPIFQEIVRRGKAAGITGFGAGEGYMRPGSMHIGFGNEAVWGAGGKGANAPDWLRTAYSGAGLPVVNANAPAQVASLDVSAATPMGILPVASETQVTAPMPQQAPVMDVPTGAEPVPAVQMTGGPSAPMRTAQAAPPVQAPAMPQQPMATQPALDPQALLQIYNNPFLQPGQRQIIGQMLTRALPPTPGEALELQKLRAEVEALENPQMSPYEQAQSQLGQDRLGLDRERFELEQGQAGLTDDLREYDRYAQQERAAGREPMGVYDFIQGMRRAAASSVNVSTGGGSRLLDKLDEATAKTWDEYSKQAATAGANAQDFQIMDQLITMAPQGPLEGRFAEMFPGFSDSASVFNSIVKRIAPTLRAPGSGSTSDIEYEGMLRALPALGNRPEANAMINEIMKAKAQINIERGNIVAAVQTGAMPPAEGIRQMTALNQRSIMTPQMQELLNQIGPQPARDDEINSLVDKYAD